MRRRLAVRRPAKSDEKRVHTLAARSLLTTSSVQFQRAFTSMDRAMAELDAAVNGGEITKGDARAIQTSIAKSLHDFRSSVGVMVKRVQQLSG